MLMQEINLEFLKIMFKGTDNLTYKVLEMKYHQLENDMEKNENLFEID